MRGKVVYAPVCFSLNQGYLPRDKAVAEAAVSGGGDGYDWRAGWWRGEGFGLMGMYKEDWAAVGGYDTRKFTSRWGKEDEDIASRVAHSAGGGLLVDRPREAGLYHVWHPERRWKLKDVVPPAASDDGVALPGWKGNPVIFGDLRHPARCVALSREFNARLSQLTDPACKQQAVSDWIQSLNYGDRAAGFQDKKLLVTWKRAGEKDQTKVYNVGDLMRFCK